MPASVVQGYLRTTDATAEPKARHVVAPPHDPGNAKLLLHVGNGGSDQPWEKSLVLRGRDWVSDSNSNLGSASQNT